MLKENQDNFIKLEGFELMMRCLQEQKYASRCVLNTVNYAITKHMEGCEKFVDCGGLKYIFPVLVGKGLKKYHKRKSSQREQRSSEQISISIISQLCAQLFQSANLDYKARITLKLVEQGFEKLLACCDLFDKYFKVLEKTENAIEKSRQRLLIEGDREAFEEYNDEDFVYIQVSTICLYFVSILFIYFLLFFTIAFRWWVVCFATTLHDHQFCLYCGASMSRSY